MKMAVSSVFCFLTGKKRQGGDRLATSIHHESVIQFQGCIEGVGFLTDDN